MNVWTFPEHPWPEEKSIGWEGVPGDAELICLIPGGRRRRVGWEEGCPVFRLHDRATGVTHVLEGRELGGDENVCPT